ncbi:hypothetical protein O6H91_09G009300 [Diphasiastrum complanatum]|uniref:Uncharacterized protein n=1 Tax=Diphasiastrum complanatum TaxID=34168 RepID=A0ACC2CLC3_DIPCM|nr:hypothetical protein O6H91_09G009300 [Diphasiastrum complanatum]
MTTIYESTEGRMDGDEIERHCVQTVNLIVELRDESCKSKVKTALSKLKGVKKVDVNIETQMVTVTGYITADDALKKVAKTGKNVELWTPNNASVDRFGSTSSQLPLTIVELKVGLHCEGCKEKIVKALANIDDVKQIDVNIHEQKVTVTGHVDPNRVLKKVTKTGKRVEFWPSGLASSTNAM